MVETRPRGALYHGGVPGRRVGEVLLPGHAEHRFVAGCPTCEAHRRGESSPLSDPATPAEWVYASEDRSYARWYASRALGGTLYRVRLEGGVEPSVEDPPQFRAWRGHRAVVLQVLEVRIVLTHHQRRQLFERCGGSPEEYAALVAEAERLYGASGAGAESLRGRGRG